jgi:hypothetical protein
MTVNYSSSLNLLPANSATEIVGPGATDSIIFAILMALDFLKSSGTAILCTLQLPILRPKAERLMGKYSFQEIPDLVANLFVEHLRFMVRKRRNVVESARAAPGDHKSVHSPC